MVLLMQNLMLVHLLETKRIDAAVFCQGIADEKFGEFIVLHELRHEMHMAAIKKMQGIPDDPKDYSAWNMAIDLQIEAIIQSSKVEPLVCENKPEDRVPPSVPDHLKNRLFRTEIKATKADWRDFDGMVRRKKRKGKRK